MTGKELKQTGNITKIALGGKDYEIAMDFNAICDLEEHYGSFNKAAKVLDGIGADFDKVGAMKDIRFLLYVMLRHSDENLTEREAGRLMTLQDMQKIMNSLGEAMGQTEEEQKNAESPQEA
jgi:hypothetical protein